MKLSLLITIHRRQDILTIATTVPAFVPILGGASSGSIVGL